MKKLELDQKKYTIEKSWAFLFALLNDIYEYEVNTGLPGRNKFEKDKFQNY